MLAWRTIRRDWEWGREQRAQSSSGGSFGGVDDWILSELLEPICPSNSLVRLTTRAASANWATERRWCKGGLFLSGVAPSMCRTVLRTLPGTGWNETCLHSWEWPLRPRLRPRPCTRSPPSRSCFAGESVVDFVMFSSFREDGSKVTWVFPSR